MAETKCLDFLLEKIYRNDYGCELCAAMGWKCPFSPDADTDQDSDGTVCRNFLRENIQKNLAQELR